MTKINGYNFRIGLDHEVWAEEKGKKISGYGLIPGTKSSPFPVEKGALQVDGMALEFNINPADSEKEWIDNINSVMTTLETMITSTGRSLSFDPVADFGKSFIDQQPPVAKKVGCAPDWNAYTEQKQTAPKASEDFRTAGGHVHISWKDFSNKSWPDVIDPLEPSHFKACVALTKMLDLFLGIPSLTWDTNVKRRQMYGKAGTFRPKTYGDGWHGVEYRPLSSAWLSNKAIQTTTGPVTPAKFLPYLIYNNALDAIKALMDDYEFLDKYQHGTPINEIINNSGTDSMKEAAARLMSSGAFKSPKFYRDKYAA